MKRAIVTADDLGKSRAINRGIEQGYREGIITSTSLMVNGEAWEDALQIMEGAPGLDTGLHLNLVEGRPISSPDAIPTLVGSEGRFYPGYQPFLRAVYLGKIALEDLEKEIRAQIERFLELHETITHLDSHQHIHLAPKIWHMLIRLSREYPIKSLRLPVERVMPRLLEGSSLRGLMKPCLLRLAGLGARKEAERNQIKIPEHFVGVMDSGKINSHTLETLFNDLKDGVTEIMTHPGIENDPSRKEYWMKEELEALLNHQIQARIREKGIELISFREWVS